MNGYDFDNTLYKGESTFDFFIFCIRKDKGLIKYIPGVCKVLIQYKLTKLSKKQLIEYGEKLSKKVIRNREQLDNYVEEFWNKNRKKLKKEIIQNISSKDIIITASPRFLIEKIGNELNTKNILCTEFNVQTGKIEFLCYREEKEKRFRKLYPKQKMNAFYTDSLNDRKMLEMVEHAYLVKGNKIVEYKKTNIK